MMQRTRRRCPGVFALTLVLTACRASEPEIPLEALELPPSEVLLQTGPRVPPVVAGDSGPARFTRTLLESFDPSRARRTLAFVDGLYRAPANDGFEAVLERLAEELRAEGFGREAGLELEFLEAPLTAARWGDRSQRHPAPAWTPLSGSVTVLSEGREPRHVHRFDAPGDDDRSMLPIYAPSGEVEGTVAFDLEDLQSGQVLVIQSALRPSVIRRAAALGAVAVLSANLEPYNVDPTGRDRHHDAIQYTRMPYGVPVPISMISPRAYETIEAACLAEPNTRVRVQASVRLDERPLRTLMAVVRGSDRAQEAFVLAAHIQEPGANDNASGVVSLLEGACSLARRIRDGGLERPSRTLVFLWGDEFRQTSTWLESTEMTPVGGISCDMTGASRAETGAICLLERMPDPGALTALPPDRHTPWGQNEIDPEVLLPSGLAVMARCALADVAAAEGEWEFGEHPYEGGSDHDIFVARRLPTLLIWHFTDFTYHTSLDRMAMVDVDEMRRTTAAILATALSAADPRPEDLDRYLRTLNKERIVRVEAAQAADDEALAQLWRDWCDGVRQWLRVECLRIPESERQR